MDYDESEPGYIVNRTMEVKVSEPRGKYDNPLVMVGVIDGPMVIRTSLTEENWAHLTGKKEFGVGTCFGITDMIEEGAAEIGVEIPE